MSGNSGLNNVTTPKVVTLRMSGQPETLNPRFPALGIVIQNDTDQPVTLTGDRPGAVWTAAAGQTYIGAVDVPSTTFVAQSAGVASEGTCLVMFYADRVISGGQSTVDTRPTVVTTTGFIDSATELRVILRRASAGIVFAITSVVGLGTVHAAIYPPPVDVVAGPYLPIATEISVGFGTSTESPPWTYRHPVEAGALVRVWGTAGVAVLVQY